MDIGALEDLVNLAAGHMDVEMESAHHQGNAPVGVDGEERVATSQFAHPRVMVEESA